MSATLITSKQMTLEEYLEFDANAEGRYEYFDGEIVEMSGGSPEHALLSSQVSYLLSRELFPRNGLIYSSVLKIKVPSHLPYRYADVTALCDKPIYEQIGFVKCLVNPALIVEVLSPSTRRYERDKKFKVYKSVESLSEYLLVWQNKKFVTLYTKHNEKFWFKSEYVAGETLKLESLDYELNVDEIYQGIIEGENLE